MDKSIVSPFLTHGVHRSCAALPAIAGPLRCSFVIKDWPHSVTKRNGDGNAQRRRVSTAQYPAVTSSYAAAAPASAAAGRPYNSR